MATAMALLLLIGLNVVVGALASPGQAIPWMGRRDMNLARTASFRRLRRDVEVKNGNLDRVVCVLLELSSPWCDNGAKDTPEAALVDETGGTEDERREDAARPCRSTTCKLFAKRKKQEKRRPPEQSPDSQFYSGW
ncbi:uncharacterized protein [Dermacentor albipictus]|uniref:uncharacterized protein n=1 Tax=Dermacentor albipictus TaxID=60249 RepID=UPI0031FD957E